MKKKLDQAHVVGLERAALTALCMRGKKLGSTTDAPVTRAAYALAAGHLRTISANTNETPDALCARLGIRGYRRTRLIMGTPGLYRWRLSAEQVRKAHHWGEFKGRYDTHGPAWSRKDAERRMKANA